MDAADHNEFLCYSVSAKAKLLVGLWPLLFYGLGENIAFCMVTGDRGMSFGLDGKPLIDKPTDDEAVSSLYLILFGSPNLRGGDYIFGY